jgi:hypothetical protein
MKKIELNKITEISDWPERILGLKPFKTPIRNNSKIEEEYNKDKYAKLLDFYKKNNVNYYELRQYEFFKEVKNNTLYYSKDDEVFESDFDEVQKIWDKIFLEEILKEIENVDTIIELGCGWGYNLGILRKKIKELKIVGGEYSQNGVDLGNKLFEKENIKLQKFDYYEEKWDSLFENVENALVFTSHSIEQIPKFEKVFDNLKKHSNKIKTVIHFEPVIELYGNSLMDSLRKKYAEINDYNRDLISTLKRENISIVEIKPKEFGINPFNPTSIVKWKWKNE